MKISRRMKWAGHVTQWDISGKCKILMRNPEGRSPFEKPRLRCEDNSAYQSSF
jgi:hypothetical protein